MVEKIKILSDWNNGLHAYTISNNNIQKISQNNNIDFKFLSLTNPDYIKNCVAYFGNVPTIDTLEQMPNLKWVHFGSAGIDKISNQYIQKRKLTITNIGDINAYPLATFCFGELFSSCRVNLISKKRRFAEDLSRNDFNNRFQYFKDFNKIDLCILGFGRTSEIISNKLASIVNKIYILTNRDVVNKKNIFFFNRNSIAKYSESVTHIINLLPLNKDNYGFVNEDFFRHFKHSPYYINVGRGETTNMHDLKHALKNKKIIGASIDVHSLPAGEIGSDLKKLDNVYLTPHIGGWTNQFWEKNCQILDFNIKKFVDGNFSEMKNLIFESGKEIIL